MSATKFTHADLLRYTGLFTFACVGIPMLLEIYYLDNWFNTKAKMLWLGSYLVFGGCYWWLSYKVMNSKKTHLDRAILLLTVPAAAGVGVYSGSSLHSILLMVVSGLLPWFMSLPTAVIFLIVQHVVVIPVVFASEDQLFDWVSAILQGVLYLGYSSFAFITSYVGRQQADAREEQRRLNAELRATRALLAESSRVGERMRISRDLHDLVGHHLTALSLNLEVASHKVNDAALEHVRQAQSVAKLLLADVREVVSHIRNDGDIELRPALRTLIEGVPSIKIHMDMPEDFSVVDPKRAHILLRTTQEIITNAVKHAKAANLWIKYERMLDGRLHFSARDDGIGCDTIAAGNGLNGMRERLAEIEGTLTIDATPGKGFAIDAFLPKETRA